MERLFVVDPDRLRRRFEKKPVTFFGVAQCFLEAFSVGYVAGKAAETDGYVELVFDWGDDQIEPAVLAGRGAGDKLVAELAYFLRVSKTRGESIAFGNDAEHVEEGVANDLV